MFATCSKKVRTAACLPLCYITFHNLGLIDVLSSFRCSFQLKQKMKDLNEELSKERSEKQAMESRIREEVTTEFMELFSNMEKDYK